MAFFQVIAKSLHVSKTVVIASDHQHPTLADAVALAPHLFCHLQCDSLMPHDFAFQDSHLQTLLRGQHVLDTLVLRMAPLNTQDRVHTLDITHWHMVALRALHVYGFVPRGLGKFPNGMGNEFSNLTSLTLGRVDGLYPQITVADFFAAVKTWRSLESLEIEHYSRLVHDPADLPNDFACLPGLLKLSLTDDPAWIGKFLTYTDTPRLDSLHLRTAATIPDANPGVAAAMLTSWRPGLRVLEETRLSSMLGGVRKVVVHMAENEHQPTRIVGAHWRRPLGMDDTTWRARYVAWSRSADALGKIISVLPSLFPSEHVSILEVSGDFDGVLADHWSTPLQHYPVFSDLKIDARGGHGVDELFGALAGLDKEGQDLVCPNLGALSVEGARYSKAFLTRVADTLEIRREAQLAYIQLNLVGSCEEYVRDFPDENLMGNTGLDAAARHAVGSFNLRISEWQGYALYSYGG